MPDYIRFIRSKVGHEKIFLNFACGVVRDDEGRILLQNRSKDSFVWGFPGGAMELGESAEEAAIREVKEETGLNVRIENLIGIYTKYFDRYPSGDTAQTIACFFRMTIVSGALQIDNKETHGLRFYSFEEAPLLYNEQHRDVFIDVRNGAVGVCR